LGRLLAKAFGVGFIDWLDRFDFATTLMWRKSRKQLRLRAARPKKRRVCDGDVKKK
jgi:hypothetical protein